MQYHKFTLGDTVIEFHNNWLGVETVIVNGTVLSKKSSILGTDHYFEVLENGTSAHYVLTTKIDASMQVLVDLSKNGTYIHQNVVVHYGSRPKAPEDIFKKKGLAYLHAYDLDDALEQFSEALKYNAHDPQIYFHMACAYSVQEKAREGFEALRKAVSLNLQDTESILTHDMLAFIRIHPAFADFVHSGFMEYEI